MKVRTRYAPSPTGRMHVGNLRTALYAYLIVYYIGKIVGGIAVGLDQNHIIQL